MPKAAGVQLLQIRNSPGALALVRANFLTTTRCDEPSLSIDELADLSNKPRQILALPEEPSRNAKKRVSIRAKISGEGLSAPRRNNLSKFAMAGAPSAAREAPIRLSLRAGVRSPDAYSARSAITGLSRLARRAGSRHANNATAPRIVTVQISKTGLCAET